MSHIQKWDLDKILHRIPHLKEHERNYFRGLCEPYFTGDGLSEQEVKKLCLKMRSDSSDPVTIGKTAEIEKHLMDYFQSKE